MQDTDFKPMYPVARINGPTNGGRMSTDQITDDAPQNVFRDKSSEDRANGVIEYEKVFAKAADDADASLVVVKAYLAKPTEGDDWGTIFSGTQDDTEADIPGADTGNDTKTKYGVAPVTTDVVAGTRTIKVTVPSSKLLAAGNDTIFRVGGEVRLSDDVNAETLEIASLTESGLEITVTTTTDISRVYTVSGNGGARLSSVMLLPTIATSYTVVGHTGGADYNAAGFEPVLDNIGTMRERFLFTFGDSVNFSITGDSLNDLGSGTVGDDLIITNDAFAKPMLTLLKGGWSGLTISGGDTFTLDTFPAAAAIWEKRETPAGAGSLTYSNLNLVVTAEVAA